MSEGYEWWVGPRAALMEALTSSGVTPERVKILVAGTVQADRWVGIEPPPGRAFTFHAPEEGSGEPAWREYRPGWAPEVDLMIARVAT